MMNLFLNELTLERAMPRQICNAVSKTSELLMAMALTLVCLQSACAESVGEVVFAIGDAHVAGQAELVKRGTAIESGQTLITGENGHIHIRFIDNAFVSVRPDSELQINQYVYDPQNAGNNQVQFTLQQGTSRLISGKAAQEAKHRFRLNTPVAAIGIRGTDFLVNTEDDVTRVAVQQGAVQVSSFGGDCQPAALGPCAGDLSRQLDGSLTGRYLEVVDKQVPQLILPSQEPGQKPFALPRPEEPAVSTQQGAGYESASNTPAAFSWGRWNSAAPMGYDFLAGNDAFVLYRAGGDPVLPNAGTYQFKATDVQAFARSSRGELMPAEVTNAKLSVNFDTMKYATQFDWTYAGNKQALVNEGKVNQEGRFLADRTKSNVVVGGGLSQNGEEAAYLFIKRLPGDDAYGIIHWVR